MSTGGLIAKSVREKIPRTVKEVLFLSRSFLKFLEICSEIHFKAQLTNFGANFEMSPQRATLWTETYFFTFRKKITFFSKQKILIQQHVLEFLLYIYIYISEKPYF